MRFADRMSEAEALMWNIEKDPWFNPNGAMVTLLDRPLDVEAFRRRIRRAVAAVPRLRQRVQPSAGRLVPPSWVPADDLDLEYHVRHLALPPPGSIRQLMDLAALLYQDPFDRTRPLWSYTVIDGVEGGRGALVSKLHHTVADGVSALRLSEQYMELERDAPVPHDVDLEAIVAEAVARHVAGPGSGTAPDGEDGRPSGSDRASGRGDDGVDLDTPRRALSATARAATGLLRWQAGVNRRAAGEVAMWGADVHRPVELGEQTLSSVRATLDSVTGHDGQTAGSSLWSSRSRHRHLESLRLDLDDVRRAAHRVGGTINDLFVTGAVLGAERYHRDRGVDLDHLRVSFVISTRTDRSVGGNDIAPTPFTVGLRDDRSPVQRFADVRDHMAAARDDQTSVASLGTAARLATVLPTSLLTRLARERTATIDFATSNLRGAPVPVFISGALVEQNVVMGPVGGTAFNVTAMSFDGSLDLGFNIDPAAVDDPAGLRRAMETAYGELIDATDAAGAADAAGASPG